MFHDFLISLNVVPSTALLKLCILHDCPNLKLMNVGFSDFVIAFDICHGEISFEFYGPNFCPNT